MNPAVSDYLLSVRGSLEIPGDLAMGQEITVKVCVDGQTDKDNQDGTVTRTWKAKLLEMG